MLHWLCLVGVTSTYVSYLCTVQERLSGMMTFLALRLNSTKLNVPMVESVMWFCCLVNSVNQAAGIGRLCTVDLHIVITVT